MKKIDVIGSTVCDMVIHLDHLPGSQADVHIKKQEMKIGGCAFNVAHFLHEMKLNYDFISPLGQGLYADFLEKELEKIGMKASHRLAGENGVCYCFVEEDGDRTFVSYHGVEYQFDLDWVKDRQPADLLYICGLELEEETGAQLATYIESYPGQVFFAPGPRFDQIPRERLDTILKQRPVLHVNEEEARRLLQILTGQIQPELEDLARALKEATGNLVIISLGAKGALVYDEEIKIRPAYPSQVLDTIGAGDSHVAAFMAAYSLDQDLEACLDFANYVAAKTVSSPGAQLDTSLYHEIREVLYERN